MEDFHHRGQIKWKTAMIMPEFLEAIGELLDSEEHIPRPVLGQDQIELLNHRLQRALDVRCQVHLRYYRQNKMNEVTGFIKKWDQLERVLTLTQLDMLELRLSIRDVTELHLIK